MCYNIVLNAILKHYQELVLLQELSIPFVIRDNPKLSPYLEDWDGALDGLRKLASISEHPDSFFKSRMEIFLKTHWRHVHKAISPARYLLDQMDTCTIEK
jgi:hypothetical protein